MAKCPHVICLCFQWSFCVVIRFLFAEVLIMIYTQDCSVIVVTHVFMSYKLIIFVYLEFKNAAFVKFMLCHMTVCNYAFVHCSVL